MNPNSPCVFKKGGCLPNVAGSVRRFRRELLQAVSVSSTVPSADARNFELSIPIQVQFDAKMNPESVEEAFILENYESGAIVVCFFLFFRYDKYILNSFRFGRTVNSAGTTITLSFGILKNFNDLSSYPMTVGQLSVLYFFFAFRKV